MGEVEADIIKISISFLVGAILGFEREYHDKPAGLRTIILITVGSTLFTLVSVSFSSNPERVASNIVTGIGFIGAGVMFRQGIDIKGITTAATVWLAAALGMAIAQEKYILTVIVLVIVLGTLSLVNKLEKKIFLWRQVKTYQVTVYEAPQIIEVESIFREMQIDFNIIRVLKSEARPVGVYKVSCGTTKHFELERRLASNPFVYSIEV